jgi:hypothetical protein
MADFKSWYTRELHTDKDFTFLEEYVRTGVAPPITGTDIVRPVDMFRVFVKDKDGNLIRDHIVQLAREVNGLPRTRVIIHVLM